MTAPPVPAPSDDPRFARLHARDRGATFLYGARTTGIFCRPACRLRRPRPENVVFFATAGAALAAGYRPCRRCRPLGRIDMVADAPVEPGGDHRITDAPASTRRRPGSRQALAAEPIASSLAARAGDGDGAAARRPIVENADPAVAAMAAVAARIAAGGDTPPTLAVLAAGAGLSPGHLQRRFTAAFGISPKAYADALRLRALKTALRDGGDVLGAAFEAGFGAASRAHALADGALGMTPATYRAGAAGETIVHAVRTTRLGPLMMAATARGVCFVQFGADEAALTEMLRAEFPRATLRAADPRADAALAAWIGALDAHLSAGGPHPDLPLDLRGTAFQIRVWRFLMRVPPGHPVSYAKLADGIGAPRAVRAAASACAANRIAVLVPCHRALRGDGGLGGFRWGLARKQALLDAEAAGVTPRLARPCRQA